MKYVRAARGIAAVTVAFGVPLAIYLVNGTIEPSAFILGAVIGFGFWYFFPFSLLP